MTPLHLSEEERALVASLLPEGHPLRRTLEALPAIEAEVVRIARLIDRRRLSAATRFQVESAIARLRDAGAPHVCEAQRLSALLTMLHGDRP